MSGRPLWSALGPILKASGDGIVRSVRVRRMNERKLLCKTTIRGDSRLHLLRLLPSNPDSLPSVHRSRDLGLGLGRGLADFYVRHFAGTGCHGFNLRATPFGEFPGDGKTHGPIRV